MLTCIVASLLLFSTSLPQTLTADTPDYPEAVWEPANPANFQPSDRPSAERPIDRIVIHDIEGSAISAVRWFQNPEAKVTSHYVVDGKSGRVYQMVKERDIAWHAGDRVTNARSIGIEHEGFAYRPGYFNPTEYEAAARLTRAVALRYDIPRDRTHIIGHFEVPDAANPGQFGGRNGHTDPGPYWDWDYFMALTRNDARREPDGSVSPLVLHPGEMKEVTVTLTNTGDDTWPADSRAEPAPEIRALGPVYLGLWETTLAGRPESVFTGPGWVSPRFAVSAADGDTAPAAVGRFKVPVHAPGFPGTATESFRLYKVPIAPRQPVAFGPTVTIDARIEPWEIVASLPDVPPVGWAFKTLADGARVLWCTAKETAKSPTIDPNRTLRWSVELPLDGEWDVYVRSMGGSGKTSRAVFRVAGDIEVVQNQNAQVGGWIKLGRFPFHPVESKLVDAMARVQLNATPTVTVSGMVALIPELSGRGTVTAGDLRFVGPFPAVKAPTTPTD